MIEATQPREPEYSECPADPLHRNLDSFWQSVPLGTPGMGKSSTVASLLGTLRMVKSASPQAHNVERANS